MAPLNSAMAVSITRHDPPTPATAAQPDLASTDAGRALLSYQSYDPASGVAVLWRCNWLGAEWSEPIRLQSGSNWFVNWADFPRSHHRNGHAWHSFLQRNGDDTYAYGVRWLEVSDAGAISTPRLLHDDDSATEHGFVSFFDWPAASGVGAVWLDGRDYGDSPSGQSRMQLRARRLQPGGQVGPENLLDGSVCDCCKTDAVATADGALVVYRDRYEDEIRDISMVQWRDGDWTAPQRVAADDWHMPACPVNGPAVAVAGAQRLVLWYTGADDEPRVRLASWAGPEPERIRTEELDAGEDVLGRVDTVALDDQGRFALFWMRQGDSGSELLTRSWSPQAGFGEQATVANMTAGRAAGFPRAVRLEDGLVMLAWRKAEGGIAVARLQY